MILITKYNIIFKNQNKSKNKKIVTLNYSYSLSFLLVNKANCKIMCKYIYTQVWKALFSFDL